MMTDKETLIGLTKQMGLAQSGDEITRLWHRDAVWFDLQFYRKSGLENCRAEFNRQFAKISNVRTEFPEIDAVVDGNVGFVRSIQRFRCDDLNGTEVCDFLTRQTDCYVKEDGKWKLIHQHVSLPTDFSTGKAVFGTELEGKTK